MLICGAVLVCQAQAAWFGGGKASGRGEEQVHRQLAPERGAAFVKLVRQRDEVVEQRRVLQALVVEKRREYETFGRTLRADFGVSPTNAYQYVRDERAVYRLQGLTNSAAASNDLAVATNAPPRASGALPVSRALERRFTASEAATFEKLLAARQITREQIAALQLLQREKQMEHERAARTLAEQFGIDPARRYRFDAERTTIFVQPETQEQARPDKHAE